MNNEERKLMQLIARQSTEAINWIKQYESINGKLGTKIPPAVKTLSPQVQQKASKFFGVEEPTCSVMSLPKDGANLTQEKILEVKHGQDMLRKAIIEFCEEFKLKEFKVEYKNEQPL